MSAIVLIVMLFLSVASLWVVFREKKEPSVVEFRSYNKSFNKLLDERYENTGSKLQPEEYLKKANSVLKELNLVDNSRKHTSDESIERPKNNVIIPRSYNPSFNGVLDEKYKNEGSTIKYGDFFDRLDYVLKHF